MVSFVHDFGVAPALVVLAVAVVVGLVLRGVGRRRGWFTADRVRRRNDRWNEPCFWGAAVLAVAIAGLMASLDIAVAGRIVLAVLWLGMAAAFVALALRARRIRQRHRLEDAGAAESDPSV